MLLGTGRDTPPHRRGLILGLGIALLVLFVALATLNAFNLSFLNPTSVLQTLVFLALSVLGFLAFIGVLVLLVRNVLKLYGDQRSRIFGTHLRTRMLWGAVLVSIVPLVFMFAFSYLLMNRAVDRWFSQPVTQMREDANHMALELFRYAAANARSEANSLAAELSAEPLAAHSSPATLADARRILARHDITLQGGFLLVYRDNHVILSRHLPQTAGASAQLKSLEPPDIASDENADAPSAPPPVLETALKGPIEQSLLKAAQRNDDPFYTLNGTDYTLASAGLHLGDQQTGLVVVALPIPEGIAAASVRLRQSADAYWLRYRERRQIRGLYMVLLLLITSVALFACCWLALNLAKQVTRPMETLAEAMEAIAAGDYAHRVGESSTEELGELVHSFNTMAADLDTAHHTAARSTAELSQVNAALQQRRSELETIIETIPNGVVTLSADRHIVVANRAFSELIDPGGPTHFIGLELSRVLPTDVMETLDRLLRRAHRMGSASDEMSMQSPIGPRQISATVALLESDTAGERTHLGYVLVLEDATALLHAQKQSAWKEVARRVAHEIKNPLTPISLNAELIQRHTARLTLLLAERNVDSPSPAVIQRSAEVISSSVQTLRSLVDQFSALAEFPSARPRPADLNAIVDNSLALFAGRLGSIRVVRSLATDLPLVMVDPEALKRALSNLIDNAAEAMQASLLRELHISTHLLPSASPPTVELAIADTGPGLTDDMRERLFLPYFSTKQRGTGLGLAIAAKIVQEHHGTIRAEKRLPAGARFIIELPTAPDLEPSTSHDSELITNNSELTTQN